MGVNIPEAESWRKNRSPSCAAPLDRFFVPTVAPVLQTAFLVVPVCQCGCQPGHPAPNRAAVALDDTRPETALHIPV